MSYTETNLANTTDGNMAVNTIGTEQYIADGWGKVARQLDEHEHSSGKGLAIKRVQSGTAASRPAAGNAGHVYVATDTGVFSIDDGTDWHTLGTLDVAQNWTALQEFSGGISPDGTHTLTLPAATDTLVGKATTDTLTNKTLTSPSMTSPTVSSGNLALSSGVELVIGGDSATGSDNIKINGAAGHERDLTFLTASDARWRVAADNTAEGGSNAGSDFALFAFADDGSFLSRPLTVTRSTGGVQVGSPTGGDKGAGTINVATGLYVNGVEVASLTEANAVLGSTFTLTAQSTWQTAFSIALPAGTLWHVVVNAGIRNGSAHNGAVRLTDGTTVFASSDSGGSSTPQTMVADVVGGVTYNVQLWDSGANWATTTLNNTGASGGTNQSVIKAVKIQ